LYVQDEEIFLLTVGSDGEAARLDEQNIKGRFRCGILSSFISHTQMPTLIHLYTQGGKEIFVDSGEEGGAAGIGCNQRNARGRAEPESKRSQFM
jgi:hypothetical protein